MSKPMNFEYSGARDGAGIAPSVSLYADRSILRSEIEEDCAEAGLRMLHSGEVSTLLEGGLALLGDVVLLDIPVTSVEQLAALCRIDMRVEASGAQLIVSTSIEALDDVFACVDQSQTGSWLLEDLCRMCRMVGSANFHMRIALLCFT